VISRSLVLKSLYLAVSILLLHGVASACTATQDRTVVICAPPANGTVPSPVQITAAAKDDEYRITAMTAYANGHEVAHSTSSPLSASVPLSPGRYLLVVRAWDSSGYYFSSQEYFTVTTGSLPVVTITANPTQISQDGSSTLTVTAQNATQVEVTDNVDSEAYQLSSTGGTVVVSPVETALYTATATGPGGSAQASTTVTVLPTGSLSAVNHVIFLQQENRTFDHYFGMLNPYRVAHGWTHGDDGKEYDVDGIDDKLGQLYNDDDEGQAFYLFHTTSSCLDDMTSAWLESFGDVSRWDFTINRHILMDGFVHVAENYAKSGQGSGQFTDFTGQRAMAYYADKDYTGQDPELNYYYWMASQFALSDRWFSPVASKSIPNRIATISGGTTQGYVHDPGSDDHAPQLTAKTIFQLLDENGISWKIYYAHTNPDGSPATTFLYFTYSSHYIYRSGGHWVIDSTHVAPLSQYYTDVSSGALPHFAYIETNYGVSDEHPGSGQSIFKGQQFVAQLINALMGSSSWSSSVFFLSYDEGGGPYEHVPPVPGHTGQNTDSSLAPLEGDVSRIAVNPDSYWPCLPTMPGDYTNHCDLRSSDPGAHSNDVPKVYGFAGQIGFRVPNMIVSPFTRKHYVGHVVMDHTAVLHFLEERYNLPPLTARDVVQPTLYDYFDFANPPWATPPSGVPTPPPVGSTCHASDFVP
jgi:phospholipase C